MISRIISAINNAGEDKSVPSKKVRYERKFVVGLLDIKQLESIIRHHPAAFREIFQKRQVNNIYLDTIDHKTYFDNVYGNTNRIKVRIRWYGETFGEAGKPVLELKIKSGLAGRKESFPLASFILDNEFSRDILAHVFSHSDLPPWVREKLTGYFPVLLNSYIRKYFVSADEKVRATLDGQMKYYAIAARHNNFLKKYEEKENIILELKYDLDAAYVASDICQHLPMRMTKSSKYVNGIELFNPHLPT